jgi:hypothetical protein
MFTSRHQNTGQNTSIPIADITFENVAEFKFLGTTAVTNQNYIHEENKVKAEMRR